MFKRILCIITTALLAVNISACAGGGGKEAKADNYSMDDAAYYSESEIGNSLGLNWGGSRIGTDSENHIVMYDMKDKQAKYMFLDSNGKKVSEFRKEAGESGHLFTIDSKGNLYVLVQNASPAKEGSTDREILMKLNVFTPKGEQVKSIDLGKHTYTDKQLGITDIAVDSKGTVYLLEQKNVIKVVDSKGKSLDDIPAKNIDLIDVDGDDKLILGAFDGGNSKSSLEKLDPENGSSIWKKALETGNVLRQIKYSIKDNKLYVLSDKGILSCTPDGRMEGCIFDLKQSSLLDSSIYIIDFTIDAKKNIYIYACKEDSSSGTYTATPLLYKYSIRKDGTKPADRKVLTLSVRYSDRYLESAVSRFEKAHPDIRVDIKDYKAAWTSTGDGGISDEENQRALKAVEDFERINNTEIMAGKGADIIEAYGLPYRKYIDNNALADLGKLIEKDKQFDMTQYNKKIIDACRYKNGLYFIPVSYSFSMLGANKSIMAKEGIKVDDGKWTWKSLLDLAQKVTKDKDGDGTPDQYALPKMSADEIFSYIYSSYSGRFIDYDKKTANFNSKEFIDLLKLTNEFIGKKVCHPSSDTTTLWKMTDPGTIAFMYEYMSGYQSPIYAQAIANGEVSFLNMPSSSGSGKAFMPGRTFAINNNSKLKNEAWEFLKVLISEEQQKSADLYDFPINLNALKDKAKSALSQTYLYDMYKKQQNRNISPLTQKDIDTMDNMIGQLDTLPYSDSKVERIVSEGVKEYFSGKKTAEETADVIQNKVSTYLGE